jgi:hypothetical protein
MKSVDLYIFKYYILRIRDWDEYQKAVRRCLKIFKPITIK